MKHKRIFLSLIIISSIANSVYAKDITDFTDGSLDYYLNNNQYHAISARGSGMGKTGVSFDDLVFFQTNPALVAPADKKLVYAHTSGMGYISRWGILRFGLFLGVPNRTRLSAVENDAVIAHYSGIPCAIKLSDKISIGASGGYISKARYVRYPLTLPTGETVGDEIYEMGTGYFYNWGVLYKISAQTTLGFVHNPTVPIDWETGEYLWSEWCSKYEKNYIPQNPWTFYEDWYKFESQNKPKKIVGKDILPESFGLGISHQPREKLMLSWDLIYRRWSQTKRIEGDKEYDPGLRDDLESHIGAEYFILNNLPLRAGIYNQRNAGSVKNESHVFATIGIGWRLFDGNLGLDIYSEDSGFLFKPSQPAHSRGASVFYRFGPITARKNKK